jgi:PIN domain nuclease of toxin-antitoxin system
MKLLLDTHAFIWWHSEPKRLPAKVLSACQDMENTLLLSVVSAWEIQIKTQLGKFSLSKPLADIIAHQQKENQLQVLPVTLPAIFALNHLPLHHRDPFDRLLIAQSQIDNLLLVSRDRHFKQYPVALFWD